MNQNILYHVTQRYGIRPDQLKPLAGGHFSRVYEFSKDGKGYVLRLTPPNDEINLPAARAILVWMDYLAGQGGPVNRPIPSLYNQLIEVLEQDGQTYLAVVFEKAQGVLAEALPVEQWNDELYRSLGRAVGVSHAIAKGYVPSKPSLKRPDWDQIGNCFNPLRKLDDSMVLISQKREELLERITGLPKCHNCYGLIHADMHFGNFFVDEKTCTFTLFDFDDCAYGWYAMEIAMTLFDIVGLYPGVKKDAFAAHFLRSYLQGYLSENSLKLVWIKQLPDFLKLLEIGIYIQVYPEYNPSDRDTWVGKFMLDRKARIEKNVPYIDLDFDSIFVDAT